MIRSATVEDAAQIAAIYNYYVENTIITFEEEAVSEAEMRTRIAHGPSYCPWLVAETDGALSGYAYATPWSARTGYRTSVETTVYVAHGHRRKGLGIELYSSLIDRLKFRDLHSALGVIALPNPGSVALHERLGFRKVGELQEIGRKLGQWVNVGYWQLLL
jgi:L-amino acid N-acyltransferase YncA